MGEIELTNTPYDDVFRTLLNDCSRLILPVLNEVFGESYRGTEVIKEGVKDAMGGKILEYEAKTIRNEGRKEGRKEGIEALVDSLRFLSIPEETIEGQLIQRYHLTGEEVKSFMKKR